MAVLKIAGKDIEIKVGNMSLADGIAIEEEYGKTIDEWEEAVRGKKLRAAAVGILVLARRSDPTITMSDILTLDLMDIFVTLSEASTNPPENADPDFGPKGAGKGKGHSKKGSELR